jgi:hypothetical protein
VRSQCASFPLVFSPPTLFQRRTWAYRQRQLIAAFRRSCGFRFLVALARCGDLLLCAKHLFVAAILAGPPASHPISQGTGHHRADGPRQARSQGDVPLVAGTPAQDLRFRARVLLKDAFSFSFLVIADVIESPASSTAGSHGLSLSDTGGSSKPLISRPAAFKCHGYFILFKDFYCEGDQIDARRASGAQHVSNVIHIRTPFQTRY